jgi:hypothetical protein
MVEQAKNFPWVRDMLASLVENGTGTGHINVILHSFSAQMNIKCPGIGQLYLDLWDATVGN